MFVVQAVWSKNHRSLQIAVGNTNATISFSSSILIHSCYTWMVETVMLANLLQYSAMFVVIPHHFSIKYLKSNQEKNRNEIELKQNEI